MEPEISRADSPRGLVVLTHPHPDFGGNRFHPFVDGLFKRLPPAGISAVRFDFSSSDLETALHETVAALDFGLAGELSLPVVIAGYSFGAGIASRVDDPRVKGWYLLAPQTPSLVTSPIGADTRPKAIAVPEHDQYSPPPSVEPVVSNWVSCDLSVIPAIDHFLGSTGPLVETALAWIDRVLAH